MYVYIYIYIYTYINNDNDNDDNTQARVARHAAHVTSEMARSSKLFVIIHA